MGATVAYVSARSELLCALGVLAALTCARRAIAASNVVAGVMAAAFGALALGSSGAAAGLPVIIILTYDAWVLRDPAWKRRFWRVYLPAMAVIALAVAWDLRAVLSAVRVPPRGPVDNLLTEAIVIWRYAGLLLIGRPVARAPVHWVRSAADPIGLLALAGIALAVAAAFRARHAAPLASFGVIWFLAALTATSTFVPLRDAMAEQRTYVAGAGLLLAAASWLAGPLATRRAARIVATGVIALLSPS